MIAGMKRFAFIVLCVSTIGAAGGCGRWAREQPSDTSPIRVVVWDERQKEQKRAYGALYLGDTIAEYLNSRPGLTATSVGQAEYHDVPSIARLIEECDVLIWWGHMLHDQVPVEVGRLIVDRIKAGRLHLIALHSSHWATPFMEAMHERARLDAQRQYADEPGPVTFEEVPPPPKMEMFRAMSAIRQSRLTPYTDARKLPNGSTRVKLYLPGCIFPAFRHGGEPSTLLTRAPRHPIAAGLPPRFTIPQTEMYDEPFTVPEPDVVIFEERWETGEWFRSGCLWHIGQGTVFYFRPGHETYPIFKQEYPLKIIENTVRWTGGRIGTTRDGEACRTRADERG
jgi:trehalose utilization protein